MTFASTADIKTLLGSAPGWRSAFKKLYVQVLIAIALGILLGAVWPSLAIDMKPLSDGFITLMRAVVPPIIFATVAVGIAKMGDMRRVGAVGVRAIIYFEVVSTIALVVGLIVGNLWQRPGSVAPASLDEKAVAGYVSSAKSLTVVLLVKMIRRLVGAVAQGDLAGALHRDPVRLLCQMGEGGQRLVSLIDDAMHALFGIVASSCRAVAAFGAILHDREARVRHSCQLSQLVASIYPTSIPFVLIGLAHRLAVRLAAPEDHPLLRMSC
jgi:aerobic C4-dicarboxylate transport protein